MMKQGDKFQQDFKITEDIYNGFISVFNDKNPLHINSDFAIRKGFDEKVMHGNILNGFLSFFIGECLPIKNVIIQTQEIKFPRPTYLNDELIFFAEITDVFESVKLMEIKFTFKNKKEQKVATGKINIGII